MSGRGRHSLPDHMVCGQATQHYVWFIVFLSCCRGFDTPRDASVSNGFKLSGLSGLTYPIGNTYDGANKTNEH